MLMRKREEAMKTAAIAGAAHARVPGLASQRGEERRSQRGGNSAYALRPQALRREAQ